MKKFILIFLIPVMLISQDFSGIRLYINPGHGGHDSDDRYIPATGFWESESNLEKGLYLYDMLKSLGAIVKISRTTNTSADDLPLSVIDADANNFDADFFHSIHSNGFQGNANYTVIFYKEVNGSAQFPQALQMTNIMKSKVQQANRTTASYSRGDYSFLGFNLGVLRTLNMPGTLSEGSFHDYIPESWRLMNSSYRKHEAWAILRSFVDYFGLTPSTYGIIAGILRNPLETVDYFFLPGSDDSKKPVNNSIVTLLPGNIQFFGDDKNNGFYFFDSLAPGNYTLIVDAENFKSDTFTVAVESNKTNFYDRNLEIVPNLNIPTIISSLPTGGANNVSLKSEIAINFDIRMDRASTENAFFTLPQISGSFFWENDDKRMLFIPADKLLPATDYVYGVTEAAKSYFNVNLDSSYNFVFRTREKLNLVDYYPKENETGVSSTVIINLKFDGEIDASSLSGNILFLDPEDKFVNILVDQTGYPEGVIKFEPAEPLTDNTEYRVILHDGITDSEGLQFGENHIIKFTVSQPYDPGGLVLEDFDSQFDWSISTNPDFSNNYEKNNSSVNFSNKRKVNGENAMLIRYKFLDDTAAITAFKNEALDISGAQNIGLWIFGDYSKNKVNLFFTDNNSSIHKTEFVDLNFSGWKFFSVDLQSLAFQPSKLNAIQIVKTDTGGYSGDVFVDDIQTNVITSVMSLKSKNFGFVLNQNYPNPFNPSTIITFSVPEKLIVSLSVYNALGQKIEELINGKQLDRGMHKIKWNANKFPSGVYFYKLSGNGMSIVKKMILIR